MKEFPDPFKANLSEKEERNKTQVKRKAPKQRHEAVVKKARKQLKADSEVESPDVSENDSSLYDFKDEEPPTRDQSTQTLSNAELKSKIETLITSNDLKTSKVVYKTISISCMSYENVIQDSQNMKNLTGLTTRQFKVLFDFLNDVCPLDKIRYWCHGKNSKQINSHKLSSQWSLQERLYICLLRLKRGFTIKPMSLMLSTPDKQINDTSIREIFASFIQLMYKVVK